MKSKTYTQSKRPSDKNEKSEFCQSSVKQTHGLKISRKKGSNFFDHRGTFRMGSCGSVWVKYHSSRLSRLLTKTLVRQLNAACLSLFGSNADFRYPCRAIGHTVGHSSDFSIALFSKRLASLHFLSFHHHCFQTSLFCLPPQSLLTQFWGCLFILRFKYVTKLRQFSLLISVLPLSARMLATPNKYLPAARRKYCCQTTTNDVILHSWCDS